jgi:hypothetical protein
MDDIEFLPIGFGIPFLAILGLLVFIVMSFMVLRRRSARRRRVERETRGEVPKERIR